MKELIEVLTAMTSLLALAVASAVALGILYAGNRFLQILAGFAKAMNEAMSTNFQPPVQPQKEEIKAPVQPLPEVQSPKEENEADPKTPPNAYCGYCGSGIEGDPSEAIEIPGKSFLAYKCPDCEEQTFLISQ